MKKKSFVVKRLSLVGSFSGYRMFKMTMIKDYIGESRQPWAIFQFPFFFGQVDNKETKINSLALM